jgi:hypothetical protein
MVTLGIFSPTTMPVHAPTAGARMASPASPMDKQHLCFALALWNGKDPILKGERSDHPFTKRSGDMVYTSVLD